MKYGADFLAVPNKSLGWLFGLIHMLHKDFDFAYVTNLKQNLANGEKLYQQQPFTVI